jgi:hypothetical protein
MMPWSSHLQAKNKVSQAQKSAPQLATQESKLGRRRSISVAVFLYRPHVSRDFDVQFVVREFWDRR